MLSKIIGVRIKQIKKIISKNARRRKSIFLEKKKVVNKKRKINRKLLFQCYIILYTVLAHESSTSHLLLFNFCRKFWMEIYCGSFNRKKKLIKYEKIELLDNDIRIKSFLLLFRNDELLLSFFELYYKQKKKKMKLFLFNS